jgi:hypothetical protein
MDPLNTFRRLILLRLIALLLPLASGCGAQLKFVTVVPKTLPGAGGWQETCLEANVQNMTTGDSAVCPVTIGMPIETEANGYIGSWWAPPESPSTLVCMNFVETVHEILNRSVLGSRAKRGCNPGIPVTRVGF